MSVLFCQASKPIRDHSQKNWDFFQRSSIDYCVQKYICWIFYPKKFKNLLGGIARASDNIIMNVHTRDKLCFLIFLQNKIKCRRLLKVLCTYHLFFSLLSNITESFPKLGRSVIFLIHTALEIPVAIQGVWTPSSLPFLELNNTVVIILKVKVVFYGKIYLDLTG